MEKLKVKFNNGNLAILCSGCSKILKIGREFTDQEREYIKGHIELAPRYCDECNNVPLEEQVNT